MDDYIPYYSRIYSLFEHAVPMNMDCGLLCNSACCHNKGNGMLLFPGEKEYIESMGHDFSILKSNIRYKSGFADILYCQGECNRRKRPLACRIFPLFPFFRNGCISVEFDPRARVFCPLQFKNLEGIYIRGLFRLRVYQAGIKLIEKEEAGDFLKALTMELDEIKRFRE